MELIFLNYASNVLSLYFFAPYLFSTKIIVYLTVVYRRINDN